MSAVLAIGNSMTLLKFAFMRVLPVLLALCLLAGLSQWAATETTKPQSSKTNQVQEDKNKKSNQSESTQGSLSAGHAISETKTSTREQQYDPYANRLYRAYLLATVIGVVGIIVLLVRTLATQRAAKAAKDAAAAALKSAQAIINAERPWMFIEIKTKLIAGLSGNPPESISFAVRLHNYGSTPAEIVGFDQHIDCRNSSDDLPAPPKYFLEGHVLAHTRMIAPGKEFEPPGEPSFVPSSLFVAEQWKEYKEQPRTAGILGKTSIPRS